MKMTDVKRKYKNKWILAKVLKEDKLHNILELKPIVVSNERKQVYESLARLKKGAHVATIFTGDLPQKGMVFAFHVEIQI